MILSTIQLQNPIRHIFKLMVGPYIYIYIYILIRYKFASVGSCIFKFFFHL